MSWTVSQLQQLVASMIARLRRPACLGAISAASGSEAQLATEDDEERLPARLLQHYGLASRPPDGSPAAAVFRAGRGSGALIIATASASYQIPLEEGEVALYHPAGASVLLDKDGNVTVRAADGKLLNFGASPTDQAMLGTALLTWINGPLLTWLNTHTNPGGGAPPSAMTPAPATLLSTGVKLQ